MIRTRLHPMQRRPLPVSHNRWGTLALFSRSTPFALHFPEHAACARAPRCRFSSHHFPTVGKLLPHSVRKSRSPLHLSAFFRYLCSKEPKWSTPTRPQRTTITPTQLNRHAHRHHLRSSRNARRLPQHLHPGASAEKRTGRNSCAQPA